MSGKYQAYPEYKDSGVEWLGKVPSHWKLIKHKYVASFIKGKNPAELLDNQIEGSLPYLSMDSLRGNVASKFAFPSKGQHIVSLNQPLVIWDGSNAGEFVRGRYGILSSTMAAAKLIVPLSQQYYWYLCTSIEPEMRKHANGMGIPHVNGEELKSIFLSLPPDEEQTQIANFLDHETAKIDTLIEKQQQLIKLLKEKRQAVISHAVIKGLNPEAPMKDSGVEWLGEVPEHWETVPLKFLVANESGIQMGPFGGMLKDLEYEDTGYKLYGQENTISGDFSRGSRWLTAKRYQELKSYELLDGDLVLTRKGSLGKARRVESLERLGVIDSDTIRIRVNTECLSSELLALLMHEAHYIAEQITRTKRGSVLPGLNSETISNLKIIVPKTLNEQEQLVDRIKQIIIFYDHALFKCFAKCELLKERRTALISAAVTGKIDVRNWQAPISQDQALEQTA